jgi:predicted dehydrogenase
MPLVKILGAGQLGSRHLQALQAIAAPLEIHVIDPSPESLKVAQERFHAAAAQARHEVRFLAEPQRSGPTDVAIVATSANVRRRATEALLAASPVRYLVLEKLLFTKREDYAAFGQVLAGTQTRAWVNCPMRMMPPYERIRAALRDEPLHYRVHGSRYGLVTNAIHYLDHVAHLTGCADYRVDTAGLDRNPVPSKRAGFLELNGTLTATFADGSRAELTCLAQGDAPALIEIFTASHRFVVRESEGKLWAASAAEGWSWKEEDARIPFQSQMTAATVQQLLDEGTCSLSPFAESVRIHLALLDPLLALLQAGQPQLDHYPFT